MTYLNREQFYLGYVLIPIERQHLRTQPIHLRYCPILVHTFDPDDMTAIVFISSTHPNHQHQHRFIAMADAPRLPCQPPEPIRLYLPTHTAGVVDAIPDLLSWIPFIDVFKSLAPRDNKRARDLARLRTSTKISTPLRR